MKVPRDYSPKIDFLRDQCPVRAALDVLSGRWKPSILWEIKDEPRRFSDLEAALGGASAQALTVQLRQLEAAGVIVRTVYPEVPARVEYHLSTHGLALAELMDQLEIWGQAHLARQMAVPEVQPVE